MRLSILMPVWNASKYLPEAIKSILDQEFGDFELLIIDDASTDNSLDIIKEFARSDKRIQIYINEKNLGTAKSLNQLILSAKGELIGRMDADDVSTPNRFKVQINFLDKHKDCGFVGCWFDVIDGAGNLKNKIRHPSNNFCLKSCMPWENFIAGASIVVRSELIKSIGGYDTRFCRFAEDYDLIIRLLEKTKAKNIPRFLYKFRVYPENRDPERLKEKAKCKTQFQMEIRGNRYWRFYKLFGIFLTKYFKLMRKIREALNINLRDS